MLWSKHPFFSITFIGIMACIIGMPPLGFFQLRYTLLSTFIQENLILATLSICISYGLCTLAMIKVLYHSFWAEESRSVREKKPKINAKKTTVITSILGFIVLIQLLNGIGLTQDLSQKETRLSKDLFSKKAEINQ